MIMKTTTVYTINTSSLEIKSFETAPSSKAALEFSFQNAAELGRLLADATMKDIVRCYGMVAANPVPAGFRFKNRATGVLRIWADVHFMVPKPVPDVPTKKQQVLDLLARPNGATGEELQQLTGWQAHTVRGFLSSMRALGARIGTVREAAGARYHIDNQ